MGSGNSFQNVSTVPMAFSESGWSWFRGAQRLEVGSPNWAFEKKEKTWTTGNEAGETVSSDSAASPMTDAEKTDAGDNIGMNIFSSSLPDLFHNKLGLFDGQPQSSDLDNENEDNDLSLEELELHAIGNLLPDDDELLAEISNHKPGSSSAQDSEDLEFFNGGGLELEGDGFAAGSTGEHASRTLFVRNINSSVEDDELRAIFERFGDIRTLYTGCKHEGLVLISYYDIRAARRAMRALQNRLLWGRKLDMHFLVPKDEPPYEASQGMVAVYNVDPAVSNDDLREIFGVYGDIKELHQTPVKNRHRFIEYYDARAAEAALRALNRHDALGKRNKLDPRNSSSLLPQFNEEVDHEDHFQQSHPSPFAASGQLGYGNTILDNGNLRDLHHQAKFASFNHPLNSLAGSLSPHASSIIGKASDVVPNYHSYPELDYGLVNHIRQNPAISAFRSREGMDELPLHRTPGFEHRGIPGSPGGIRPGLVGGAASSGLPFLWGNSQLPPQSSSLLWPPSAHLYAGGQPKVHGCGLQSHLINPVLAYPQVGGIPYGEKGRDRRRGFLRQSTGPGCVGLAGSLRLGANGGLGRTHAERKGELSKGTMGGVGRFSSRHRNRRGDSNAADREQFHLDLDRIISGEDKRTTLMLKNIPNKYTSKMLLAVIDESNQGTYDFIYLPIDFKNKCNVGYAFVNMIEPSYIINFYKAFNGKKWEKFNSEKVASVAYARIQGKAALVAHFQNSSLMNECRPIVFGDEGATPDDPGKEIGIVIGSEESKKTSKDIGIGMDSEESEKCVT